LKRLSLIGCFVSVLGLASWSHAQASPTASRTGVAQIGGGVSLASPDYGQRKFKGITIYGTFDFTRHWGIEGDVHKVSIITPTDIGKDSYLLGPRYVFHHKRFNPYAKGSWDSVALNTSTTTHRTRPTPTKSMPLAAAWTFRQRHTSKFEPLTWSIRNGRDFPPLGSRRS
jgi:hypothetical protein